MSPREEVVRFILVFLLFLGLPVYAVFHPDWGKSDVEKKCDAAGGSYFRDRDGRNICLAPGVTLK